MIIVNLLTVETMVDLVYFMSSPSVYVSLEGAIHRSRNKISEVQKNMFSYLAILYHACSIRQLETKTDRHQSCFEDKIPKQLFSRKGWRGTNKCKISSK